MKKEQVSLSHLRVTEGIITLRIMRLKMAHHFQSYASGCSLPYFRCSSLTLSVLLRRLAMASE